MVIGRAVALRIAAVVALALGLVVMHHIATPDDHNASPHHSSNLTTSDTAAAVHDGAHDDDLHPSAAHHGDSHALQAENDGTATGHELLHLCLFIVTTAALGMTGLVLAAWLRQPRPWSQEHARANWILPARPPPRLRGSTLLVSLCVMRT